MKVAVIGAGPSGITAAKNVLCAGFDDLVVFEKSDQVGGNWVFREEVGHASVYETTHIISSKRLSQYVDFPMPDHYPDYPSHEQMRAYFQDYARAFEIEKYIRFASTVTQVKPEADHKWRITSRDPHGEHTEVFDYLMVCSGHHHDPYLPEYPGHFSGKILHSHEFKRAAPFENQRVLVVGGGNSACDVAVETSRVSARTCISMRRGYYIIPKFIMGVPPDIIYSRMGWIPRWLRPHLLRLTIFLVVGRYSQYGLKEPDCHPLEMHPTLNSELLYFIRHGKIHPRVGIERFDEHEVVFCDGTREAFDSVIFATGYRTSHAFFDKDLIDFSESLSLPLYRKMMHPDFPSLFFIGLFQPQGCIWSLADLQAQLAVAQMKGSWQRPADLKRRIEHEMMHPHFRFQKSRRHAAEVDFDIFRKELLADLKGVMG